MSAFDPRAALLAKHAQHVVLVHFPIALFIVGVALDMAAERTRNRLTAAAAYYNLLLAAASALPVLLTGILAWRFALEGVKLKGILLQHLVLAVATSLLLLFVARIHWRAHRTSSSLPRYRLPVEVAGCLLLAATAHLGGFLTGVNG